MSRLQDPTSSDDLSDMSFNRVSAAEMIVGTFADRVPLLSDTTFEVFELGGGSTNSSYRIDLASYSVVFKLFSPLSSELSISRESEFAATLKASELGVGPELIYYDDDILVTQYVNPDNELQKDYKLASLANTLSALKRFHDSDLQMQKFDPIDNAEAMATAAIKRGAVLPKKFSELFERAKLLQTIYEREELSPCHNDLNLSNVLLQSSIPKLIDWEYAGLNNPLYDIAKFCNHHFLDLKTSLNVVASYHPIDSSNHTRNFTAQRFFAAVWSISWLILQVTSNPEMERFIKIRTSQAEDLYSDILD